MKDTTSTFSEATERVHGRALWRPGNVPVCAGIYDPIGIVRSCDILPGLQSPSAPDVTRLSRELGWRPSRSLGEALDDTIDWWRTAGGYVS